MTSSENYVSDYLLRPLRSYAECLREHAQKRLLRESRARSPAEAKHEEDNRSVDAKGS